MLSTGKKILDKANRGKYAVGAFNINNMEFLQAIVEAADKLKSPVMIATSEGAIKYAGMNYLKSLVYAAAESVKVPVALHLDHGQDMNVIEKCIKSGWTSVMIDASHHDFKENVRLTRKVVQMARRKNVSVEAEIGTIGGKEEQVESKHIIYTDPAQAEEFVRKTGIDCLAVAIGTSHGAYKFPGESKLNFKILKEIKKRVKIPLVLHGASGLPDNVVDRARKAGVALKKASGVSDLQIKRAIKLGINKINTDTDLRLAFTGVLREAFNKKPGEFDPRKYFSPARDFVREVVERRIKVFGSGKKA